MLKSRRGMFAAGLAAAVIGSVGVVSTLTARAEQVPSAPPAVESAVRPPATLPWGERPRPIRAGRAGADSNSLKAAGLSAAAAAESGEERAPKGRTSRTSFLSTQKTDVVPPEPPGARPTVNFHYNVGAQAAEADGVYANLTINKPKLDDRDYHTLAEIAVQSADGAQIVEVGWNVDRVVNGDDDPHLFVYHWVNRKTSCYNGCGYVQYSKTVRPGDTLTRDTVKRFGIQYFDGAWWIAYDTEWVGYYPDKLWRGEFTRSGLVQVFGEVAAASSEPCTEMGSGLPAGDNRSAWVGSVAYLNGPPVQLAVRSTSEHYKVSRLSHRTFRYGGPGAC